MAQICRVNKSEVSVLIRTLSGNYRCYKRCQSNYYETLRIPQDATQKEIKDAFITLSKEMHPDCGNKGNHSEFVKLNEAYSVLSKKDSRHYYDIGLKSNIKMNYHNFHYNGAHVFHNFNKSQGMKPSKKETRRLTGYCIAVMIFGTILEAMYIKWWSDYNKRKALARNARLELEYQNTMDQRRQLLKLDKYKFNFHDK